MALALANYVMSDINYRRFSYEVWLMICHEAMMVVKFLYATQSAYGRLVNYPR